MLDRGPKLILIDSRLLLPVLVYVVEMLGLAIIHKHPNCCGCNETNAVFSVGYFNRSRLQNCFAGILHAVSLLERLECPMNGCPSFLISFTIITIAGCGAFICHGYPTNSRCKNYLKNVHTDISIIEE